tara:strand:- start:109 stop:1260 length:1152 start_codon:yes stop_codon:yes gene_type:complete
MSDLKKTIEEEYLINDVLKLIMEAVDSDMTQQEAERFYEVAFEKLFREPSQNDLTEQNFEKFKRAFGFGDLERSQERFAKVQRSFEGAFEMEQASSIADISKVLTQLETMTMFYNIVNSPNASSAGFVMEYLFSLLVVGQPPTGNPIPDVTVEDADGLIKLYSLKTYTETSSRFGGSFANLIKMFKGADKNVPGSERVGSVVYVTFLKQKAKGQDEVASLRVLEARMHLGPSDPSNNVYNVFEFIDIAKLFNIPIDKSMSYDDLFQNVLLPASIKAHNGNFTELDQVIYNFQRRNVKQFSVLFKKKMKEVARLNISRKAITDLILLNSSDLKGIITETYEELDRLNSSIQQFFREGKSNSSIAANEASKNLAVLTGQFTKLKE